MDCRKTVMRWYTHRLLNMIWGQTSNFTFILCRFSFAFASDLDPSPAEDLRVVAEVLHDGGADQVLHQVPVAEVLAAVALGAVLGHLDADVEVAGGDAVHLELHQADLGVEGVHPQVVHAVEHDHVLPALRRNNCRKDGLLMW